MGKDKRVFFNGWHAVPIKGTFVLTSMVGFLVSAYLVYPRSVDYGITLMLIFILMFIASLISLSKDQTQKHNKMVKTNQLSWTFPQKTLFFIRIERYYISLLALFIFIYFYFGTTQFIMALLYTVLFLGIYVLTTYLVSLLRKPSEEYSVTKTHIHIHRKTKKSSKKHKIALKDVDRQKVDHFFRGGYVVLKNGTKHVLFFNSEDESKLFAAWVEQHSKPKVAKKVSKKKVVQRKSAKKR